jgi:sulfur carrier protein
MTSPERPTADIGSPRDIDVVVNGAPQRVRAATLSELLAELGLGDAKVATAVNGAFVPAASRQQQPMANGDRVEIVSPRQGG